MAGAPLFKLICPVIEWRGPAPFYFAELDSDTSDAIKVQSKNYTYGWGVLYVHGTIGKTHFQSALMPKNGRYLLPLKDSLRNAEAIELGSRIKISLVLGKDS